MSGATQVLVTSEQIPAPSRRGESLRDVASYIRRNPSLGVGIVLLLALLLFVVIGHLTVDTTEFRPLSARPLQPPSRDLPFGTDKQGRNLYAVMVEGTPLTLRIGLLAGVIGVALGAALAFIAGYYGGWIDNVIRVIVDVGLTIPGLLILIIIGMRVRGGLTVDQMALVVGLLAWLYPARTIRSQVLTIKQRGYVQVARLSGMSNPEVIVKELLPNLLPYLGASLVVSVSAAILASIGLEVLGLGPFEAPTLGMTIYWVNYNAAIINGWWWWWVPPIIVIGVLFIGLFLVAVGLDEIANPRVRNRV
ncbi:MAG: ABC transporter permease [Thermomicrobiales bacterium]|nr:ABC transporter permease [Thermomicrobiales bacterium]